MFKVDDKVKCLSNSSGSGLVPGREYRVKSIMANGNITVKSLRGEVQVGGWCTPSELEHVTLTKKQLQAAIKKAKEEVKELELQYKFVKENGLDEFSKEAFKAFKVMKLLKLGGIKEAMEITKILSE